MMLYFPITLPCSTVGLGSILVIIRTVTVNDLIFLLIQVKQDVEFVQTGGFGLQLGLPGEGGFYFHLCRLQLLIHIVQQRSAVIHAVRKAFNHIVQSLNIAEKVGAQGDRIAELSLYTDENLESDVASVMAIHKFRQGIISNNIESSGYVFVTNNADFVQTFNKYYRENVEKETFQLAITVNALSAITWIKNGEVENLPRQHY
jgi:hypothetical protein